LTDCGASGESCCTSLPLPAGNYARAYLKLVNGATISASNPATVSDVRLDKYLVTVGRFRQFVQAWNMGAGFVPSPGSGKHAYLNAGAGLVNSAGSDAGSAYEPGWQQTDDDSTSPTDANLTSCNENTWTTAAGSQETLPINCVTWAEAYAFCIWDGGFLPSESEWGYAASGGDALRLFPWGAAAPTVSYAIWACDYPAGSLGCSGLGSVAPVGTATQGAARWGQLDMVGELYEWTLDWFTEFFVDPCRDCAYLSPATDRAIRGSAFDIYAPNPLADDRSFTHEIRRHDLGLRCARAP
jgi:formylglycine-generating enzyme required for sulfatase activity